MAIQAPITAPELNAEQSYLRRIDRRISMLTLSAPGSTELARMQAARKDVLTRLSPEELAAYDKAVNPQKSSAQVAAEAETERLAMEANRDKPPI